MPSSYPYFAQFSEELYELHKMKATITQIQN